MDILGIDVSKAKLDVALLVGQRTRHATFPNTEAGFEQLLAWLARHRADPAAPLHACLTLAPRAFPCVDGPGLQVVVRHRRRGASVVA